MNQHRRGAAGPQWSVGRKVGTAAAVLVGGPVLIAGIVRGVTQGATAPAAPAAPARTHSAPAPPTTPFGSAPPLSSAAPVPAPGPTFVYPGDPQCKITYADVGGSAVWTVTTAVGGELISHAADADGTIYRHDEHATAGTHTYRAPVPLAQITDLGGNLHADSGSSYGCSVAPQK